MVILMNSILEKKVNEIIIKNSRFIGILIPLENNNYKDILEEIKQEYPKADHYCYGMIYDKEKYSSDDREPSQTAGLPILNVLEKEDLNHILAVVVRYFGGIKLGAGGLVRAYTKATTECLKLTTKIELEKGYTIQIEFPYEEEKNIKYILQNSKIIEESYQEIITYKVEITEEELKKLEKYHPTILEEIQIKKNHN